MWYFCVQKFADSLRCSVECGLRFSRLCCSICGPKFGQKFMWLGAGWLEILANSLCCSAQCGLRKFTTILMLLGAMWLEKIHDDFCVARRNVPEKIYDDFCVARRNVA